jgi:hypothetical protein
MVKIIWKLIHFFFSIFVVLRILREGRERNLTEERAERKILMEDVGTKRS